MDMDMLVNSVSKKYEGLFSEKLPAEYDNNVRVEDIYSVLLSKHNSFRYKTNITKEAVERKILEVIRKGEPLRLRVAWGFGKDPRFREYDEQYWYLPDMADIYSLALVRDMESKIKYPIKVTITSSWDRYLGINFYAVGRAPPEWLEEGLKKYNKAFKAIIAELMPEAELQDSYDLSRVIGLDLDKEVESNFVKEEYRRLSMRRKEIISEVEGSVVKHSQTPHESLERYLKERIAESRFEDYIFSIHFGRAVQEDKIQYRTIPNRKVFEIIPPWEAKGSVEIVDGEWIESMTSLKKIKENGMPDFSRDIRIGSHEFGCWFYVLDFKMAVSNLSF